MRRYSKAIVALLGAAATWAATALDDSGLTTSEWFGLGAAVLGVIAVYQVRNAEPEPAGDGGQVNVLLVVAVAALLVSVLYWYGVDPPR
jgi:hypothetical protein